MGIVATVPRFTYATASTLNGFLATTNHSLDWLFAVPGGQEPDMAEFLAGVGVLVMGSHTFQWLLEHERLLENPAAWTAWYDDRPAFVFSSRELQLPAGLDLRVVSGTVASALPEIRAAAGDLDVWLVGGGDLVGQFLDAGALDEIRVTLAPVTLVAGMPLLPRRLESDRLALTDVTRTGQFVELRYTVSR